MKGLEGKYLIITEDYTDSEVGEWSGWRDLNPHSTLNPKLKLSYVNSTTSNSQFTFV